MNRSLALEDAIFIAVIIGFGHTPTETRCTMKEEVICCVVEKLFVVCV